MSDRPTIISLTPGKEESITTAQKWANERSTPYGVWEHVGLYGRVERDVPARHTFKIQRLDRPDPSDEWALVACVDPDVNSRVG